MAILTIKNADEIRALDSLERQVARRAARQRPLCRYILRRFADRGGPIAVADIAAAFQQEASSEAIHDALIALDEDDLIRVRDGHVDIAYPFSAVATAFVVRLPGGQEQSACCAMDALGIAPMLGLPVDIRSRCHHCAMPIEFPVAADGPGPGADGVMLWFGTRGDERCKVADSL